MLVLAQVGASVCVGRDNKAWIVDPPDHRRDIESIQLTIKELCPDYVLGSYWIWSGERYSAHCVRLKWNVRMDEDCVRYPIGYQRP